MTLTRTLKTLGLLAVSTLAAFAVLATPNATAQGYIAKYNFMWDLANEGQSGSLAEKPPLQGYQVKNNFMWERTINVGLPGILAEIPPVVTAFAPSNNATAVPINTRYIAASFNEPMLPGMSFTMTCRLGNTTCAIPTGTFSLNFPTDDAATFTLATGTTLVANAVYTVTVVDGYSRRNGIPLADPLGWTFTAGTTSSAVNPIVVATLPITTIPGPTPNVPANTSITATFSKQMAPASINKYSFEIKCDNDFNPCPQPDGVVNYYPESNMAVFRPKNPFPPGIVYDAAIIGIAIQNGNGATDLQGNYVKSFPAPLDPILIYEWSFVTVAPPPATNVTVSLTNPADLDNQVCTNASINATFQFTPGYAMDPATVNSGTFTVTGQDPNDPLVPVTVMATSVALDPTGTIATFLPDAELNAGWTYTATITGGVDGVKDLATPADIMLNDYNWSFTAINCQGPTAPLLGLASTFGDLSGTGPGVVALGTTNSGTLTFINGDLGSAAASGTVTGFHDSGLLDGVQSCIYNEIPGVNTGTVTGLIYTGGTSPANCGNEGTGATLAIARAATSAALNAYIILRSSFINTEDILSNPNLAGVTLPPDVYASSTRSFVIQGGDLTLDAQGNANAIWIFQIPDTLMVGDPGTSQNVKLINGAQANNVYWQVGGDPGSTGTATINPAGGGTMVGTIIANGDVTISAAGNVATTTLNGRAFSLNGAVNLANTVIYVPGR